MVQHSSDPIAVKNTFSIPIIPDNDEQRLKALYRYEILDTPPEGAFNRIAELAVKLFNVPIALVSLVDKDRVFFKANVGIPGLKSTERGESLCSLAVMQKEPTVFEDAENEPCLLANPLVAGSFGLKFYAGAPLVTSDGFNIGTFCIIDKKTKKFSEKEKEMLRDLAAVVMDEIEIRISSIKAIRTQQDLLHIAAHDLKNPLSNIQALSELLKNQKEEHKKEKIAQLIQESSANMISLIDRLVKLSEIENKQQLMDLKPTDIKELVSEVIQENKASARKKEQSIHFEAEGNSFPLVDRDWMREILDNLINNAIKYSPQGKSIAVYVKAEEESGLYLEVKDQGQGFSEEDLKKAFQKFSRLSSKPTGGESSTGLGLSIVKTLVEFQGGTVSVESEGKNKGSRIKVFIPNAPSLVENKKEIS